MINSFIRVYKKYKSISILNYSIPVLLLIGVIVYYGIYLSPESFGPLDQFKPKIDLINFSPYAFLPILLFIFVMYDSVLLKLLFILPYIFNLSYVFYYYILLNRENLGLKTIALKIIPYIASVGILLILKEILNRIKINYRDIDLNVKLETEE